MNPRLRRRTINTSKQARRTPTASTPLILVVVPLAGILLWWSGNTPGDVAQTVTDWRNQPAGVVNERWLEVLVVSVAWLIVLAMSGLLGLRLAGTILRAGRAAKTSLQEGTPRTFLGVFLTFFVGSHGADMHAFTCAAPRAEPINGPDSVKDTPHDSAKTSPIHAHRQSTQNILPALSSAGLALGVTRHIQRERALLLRDAPNSAQLKRPDATSLAAGISLFERAESTRNEIRRQSVKSGGSVLLPLGVSHDKLVSLVLEPGEVVSIEAPTDEGLGILRHLINTVALAPWLRTPAVIVVGFKHEELVVDSRVVSAESPSLARHHALHARETDPSSSVIVITKSYSQELEDLPRHGVMVVSAGWPTPQNVTRVIRECTHWRISATDEVFLPYGISLSEAKSIRAATVAMTTLEQTPESTRTSRRLSRASGSTLVPPGAVLIRVLGPVQAEAERGEISFRKAKSLELLCWLAFHRDCPTVSGARTALWEIDVKDATFHNVLSELRHGLSVAGFPQGAGRITKHRLFLNEHICTDAEYLRECLLTAESGSNGASIRRLSDALLTVRGLPFSSAGYAWADAEGITSTLVWRITRAVELVANVAAVEGNRTALLEAVAAGLRMSPGDEDFLALQELVVA